MDIADSEEPELWITGCREVAPRSQCFLHHIPPRKMGQSLSICLQVEGLRLDQGVR
jgi:hypothetical protein